MKDIRNQKYSEWLEELLKNMVNFDPNHIAFIAMNNRGETATCYFNCEASDLAMMDGVLQQDALFRRIEANRVWLKNLVDSEDVGDEYDS